MCFFNKKEAFIQNLWEGDIDTHIGNIKEMDFGEQSGDNGIFWYDEA